MLRTTLKVLTNGVAILCTGIILYYSYQYAHKLPCDTPRTYAIGTIDPKFYLSDKDVRDALAQAESIWEKPLGKNLFQYDRNGEVVVNFVYDKRQETAIKNKVLTTKIDSAKNSADSIKQDFTAMKVVYEQKEAAYNNLLAQYSTKLSAYNQEVDYWNSQGGAGETEYQKLQTEKAGLDATKSRLGVMVDELKLLSQQINDRIAAYNTIVGNVNENVNQVNSTAGEEFNEGLYQSDKNGERITVYEYTSKQELIRVLAHELGHALGLEHNDNPESIMYRRNDSKNMTPTMEDILAVKIVCKLQ